MAESALGRLFLRGGLIEQDEDEEWAKARYDAGSRYAAVVGAYRATIEAPRTTAGSGRGVSCLLNRAGGAETCYFAPDDCICLRRRKSYQRAFEALADAGRAAMMSVNRIVIQGADPIADEVVNLRHGLLVLARHFGLTGRADRGSVRNAN